MFLLRYTLHPGPGATSAISRVELQSETSLCLFTICSTIIAKTIKVEQCFFTNKAEKNNCSVDNIIAGTGTMYIVQGEALHIIVHTDSVHIAQILQGSAKHCAQVQCTSSQLTWHMTNAHSVTVRKPVLSFQRWPQRALVEHKYPGKIFEWRRESF